MRDRYIVSNGRHAFYIYDLKEGMSEPVATFPLAKDVLAHDTCLMLNNRERFWAWTEKPLPSGRQGMPRAARKHAGVNAIRLGE